MHTVNYMIPCLSCPHAQPGHSKEHCANRLLVFEHQQPGKTAGAEDQFTQGGGIHLKTYCKHTRPVPAQK